MSNTRVLVEVWNGQATPIIMTDRGHASTMPWTDIDTAKNYAAATAYVLGVKVEMIRDPE